MFCGVEREGLDVVGVGAVTHEAASRMRVKSNHEEEREVMCIPECLEALIANFPVCRRIHQHDDEKHEVASDASGLRIMDLQSVFLTDLSSLDVQEVDIMGSGVHHSPERHLICNLPVEPNVLIRGERPSKFGPDDTDNIPEHREQDETTIVCKHKTGTARTPDGPLEGVQTRKFLVCCLTVPTIRKEKDMRSVEEDVEEKSPRGEKLSVEPAFTHDCRLERRKALSKYERTPQKVVRNLPDEEREGGGEAARLTKRVEGERARDGEVVVVEKEQERGTDVDLFGSVRSHADSRRRRLQHAWRSSHLTLVVALQLPHNSRNILEISGSATWFPFKNVGQLPPK